MQDPVRELPHVVQDLCCTSSPDVQKRTIERYFTEDAGFDHPLCCIVPGRGSREGIYGIYSWYKKLCPDIPPLAVTGLAFNEAQGRLYADITQQFTVRFTPWRRKQLRLIAVLSLVRRSENGLWYIKQQEDFYQPEVILSVGLPWSHTAILTAKYAAGYFCEFAARAGNLIGWWAPQQSSTSKKAKAS